MKTNNENIYTIIYFCHSCEESDSAVEVGRIFSVFRFLTPSESFSLSLLLHRGTSFPLDVFLDVSNWEETPNRPGTQRGVWWDGQPPIWTGTSTGSASGLPGGTGRRLGRFAPSAANTTGYDTHSHHQMGALWFVCGRIIADERWTQTEHEFVLQFFFIFSLL